MPSRPATALFAALLAADGMTGPAPLFEGEMGFFQQVSGPFSLAKLGGPAADDWMLPKTSIKFVPAEYHSQSAIAAAFDAAAADRRPAQIRSIEIATFRVGRRDHRQGPREVAAQDPRDGRPQPSLLHGRRAGRRRDLGQTVHAPSGLRDPALLDLVSRTTVVEDPKLTAGYPAGIPNRVTVTLDDGTKLVEEVAFPPGHDKNPLTDDQLADKFHGLVDPVLGREQAQAIWDRVLRLEDDPTPHSVLKLIKVGTPE